MRALMGVAGRHHPPACTPALGVASAEAPLRAPLCANAAGTRAAGRKGRWIKLRTYLACASVRGAVEAQLGEGKAVATTSPSLSRAGSNGGPCCGAVS